MELSLGSTGTPDYSLASLGLASLLGRVLRATEFTGKHAEAARFDIDTKGNKQYLLGESALRRDNLIMETHKA
jgi:hypothetical protein